MQPVQRAPEHPVQVDDARELMHVGLVQSRLSSAQLHGPEVRLHVQVVPTRVSLTQLRVFIALQSVAAATALPQPVVGSHVAR